MRRIVFKHELVALLQASEAEVQASERIFAQAVDSGLIEDDSRAEPLDPRQGGRERVEVGAVFGAVVECHVERRALLTEREVVRAVEGEREDIGVVFEKRSRAIALMYVEIEDGRAQMQRSNGDSEVIEHAEARAVVRKA
jgi:hypothetical protein